MLPQQRLYLKEVVGQPHGARRYGGGVMAPAPTEVGIKATASPHRQSSVYRSHITGPGLQSSANNQIRTEMDTKILGDANTMASHDALLITSTSIILRKKTDEECSTVQNDVNV
jgi:hypothetical protein